MLSLFFYYYFFKDVSGSVMFQSDQNLVIYILFVISRQFSFKWVYIVRVSDEKPFLHHSMSDEHFKLIKRTSQKDQGFRVSKSQMAELKKVLSTKFQLLRFVQGWKDTDSTKISFAWKILTSNTTLVNNFMF